MASPGGQPPVKLVMWAYALLTPAPFLFALRSSLTIMDRGTPAGVDILTGISGALSLIGLALLSIAGWRRPWRRQALLAIVLALLGHYVIGPYVNANLGPALVYLGTGVAIGILRVRGLIAGAVAALGAVLRAGPPTVSLGGNVLVMIGALWLGVVLGTTAWQMAKRA